MIDLWLCFNYFRKIYFFRSKISHDKQYGWAIGIELRFKKMKKKKMKMKKLLTLITLRITLKTVTFHLSTPFQIYYSGHRFIWSHCYCYQLLTVFIFHWFHLHYTQLLVIDIFQSLWSDMVSMTYTVKATKYNHQADPDWPSPK